MKYIFTTLCLIQTLIIQLNLGAHMNPKSETSIVSGVYAASLTPINDDLSCNCEALFNHCNDLMNRGCKGVVLFGTSGESCSFSAREKEEVLKNVIQLGLDPQKIIVGISSSSIEDAVKLTSVAMDQHCAAVLVVPPYFYKKVDDEGVINFYKKYIESVNDPELKVLLYHIPQYSGVPITINIIRELISEFPNTVVGIKDSAGDIEFTKEILSTFDHFMVFLGSEIHISESVQLGAAGSISGLANPYPELICSLYEYGKDQTKPNHNPMIKNVVSCIKKYPLFPAIKGIVEHQKGADWHIVRPPLVPLNKQQYQELNNSLK